MPESLMTNCSPRLGDKSAAHGWVTNLQLTAGSALPRTKLPSLLRRMLT